MHHLQIILVEKLILFFHLINPKNNGFSEQDERLRRIFWTIFSSLTGRILIIITPFITIPITRQYLGDQRFSIWMTISSFMAMMSFTDFGIGNGLLTELSKCKGRRDYCGIRKLIATGYITLGSIAIIGLCILFSLQNIIPWGRIVNTSEPDLITETHQVALVSFGCFFLGIPFGLIRKIQLAMQKGFVCDIWDSCGGLVSLGALLLAIYLRSSIGVLVFCVVGIPLFSYLLNSIVFFWRTSELRWNFTMFDRPKQKLILSTGIKFFLLSLLTSLSLYCDNLIVAHVVDLKEVAIFTITSKPARILLMLTSVICIPLWPANGEALMRGDLKWVRKNTLRMSLLCFGTTLLGALGLLSIGPFFFHWWIGNHFPFSFPLLLGMSVWPVILGFISPYFMVLNSKGQTVVQIKMWSVYLVISVCCKVFLARKFGVSGIPWGAIIPYCFIIIPWTQRACYKIFIGVDK